VFANDDMALGGMRTLQAAGVRVPDDIAIVGFDDFGLARVTSPGITTIRVPAEEMARIATERLFALLDQHAAGDGAPTGPSHIELPVELVTRGSCGCTPAL
jgi:DNA-binding LacI/PurR family transcriptional regulator